MKQDCRTTKSTSHPPEVFLPASTPCHVFHAPKRLDRVEGATLVGELRVGLEGLYEL